MATQNTFDFGDQQAATKSLKKIGQLMQRAGQPVVSSSFDQKIKRTSGVSYREAMLTLASGQTITMRVTQSGDVFQVLLNGQVKPIKNAGDQIRAVGEIAKLAEANQAAFQKKQARVKTELPKGIKTAAPKMEVALQARVSELDAQIAERQQQVAELKTELGDEAADGAGSAQPGAMVDAANFTAMRGHVANGTRIKFKGGMTLTLKSTMTGWELVDAGGVRLGQPLSSAAAVEAYIAQLDSSGIYDSVGMQPAGFPMKWHDGKMYNRDQFNLEPTDEHGEMPPAWVLKDGAVPVDHPSLDDTTLDAARKHNQKDYAFYVVVGSKIESGWSFDEDAKEHKADNMPQSMKATAKVLKKAALKSKGIDPDDNASWLTSGALDSADLAEAIDLAAQVIDGTVLDGASTASAVATLRVALGVVENNYPINLAAGNIEQAELELENAESFRTAIALLDGTDGKSEMFGADDIDYPDEAKPSRAADDALKAAAELQDNLPVKDSAEEEEPDGVSPDQQALAL